MILLFVLFGVFLGVLLVFILSFDDFVVMYFISGLGFKMLLVLIYILVKKGVMFDINVFLVMLVLFMVLLLVMGNVFL